MLRRLRDLFKPKAATLAAPPSSADLWKAARSIEERGDLAFAAAAYRAILESYPAHMESMAALAPVALRLGDLEESIRLYGALIAQTTDDSELYYKRAIANSGLGRWEAALSDYDAAIAIDPGYANAYCNRGTALERLQRRDEALASYDRAIALNPRDFLAYYNRGSILTAFGRLEEALADYEQAIVLKNDYVEAYINRGNVLRDLQRDASAIENFDRAIALDSRYPEAFVGRGTSLFKLGRFEAALESFNHAIDRNSALAHAYHGRGHAEFRLRRFEAAIASFDRAIELQPDSKFIFGTRAHVKAQICDWHEAATDLRRITGGLLMREAVCEPFAALSLVDSPALHRLAAEVRVREECPTSDALRAIASRARRDRIRVGYFSPDFRNHPTSILTAQMFETHDRSRFEITAFAFGPEADDAMSRRMERTFDRFIDVRAQTDAEVATLARKLEIDIAVDLGVFTDHCRPMIFALRAAPVQINFLGYPGTSGAAHMDYIVADRMLIPLEECSYYSEKIIYLPHTYQPNDSMRPIADANVTRADLQLPETGFVFCCFNNNFKICTETFDSWMRIVRRIENSVLWLLGDNPVAVRNLRKEAADRGIDPNRLVFATRMPPSQHLARQRAADLFLDTLPYNAHTTASDALLVGLPVLTLRGKSFPARVASSLLSAMEMPELITSTRQDYEELAVRLADDPPRLRAIREKLARKRQTAPLFDTPLFAEHLEDGFTQTYERHLADLPHTHIFVEDRSRSA